jgi:hypothetical protein
LAAAPQKYGSLRSLASRFQVALGSKNTSEQKQLRSELVALRNRNLDRAKAAQAVDPDDLPMLTVDRQKPAEQTAVAIPGAASRHSLDGPS